jgi:hypothetical protein
MAKRKHLSPTIVINADARSGGSEAALKYARVINAFDDELVEIMENMDNDELKGRVLQSQQNLLTSELNRAEDDNLIRAKMKHDTLKKPYEDAKKFQTAIINYGILLLDERGASLSEEEEDDGE